MSNDFDDNKIRQNLRKYEPSKSLYSHLGPMYPLAHLKNWRKLNEFLINATFLGNGSNGLFIQNRKSDMQFSVIFLASKIIKNILMQNRCRKCILLNAKNKYFISVMPHYGEKHINIVVSQVLHILAPDLMQHNSMQYLYST